MTSQQRVVWYEGMTLDPHHFQQWDRSFRALLSARFRAANSFDWGLLTLDVDRESLTNGEFALRSCRGVTRDGVPFDIPASDPPPAPRRIDERFLPTEEKLAVYLALPLDRSAGGNCLLDGAVPARPTRYSLETITIPDDNTGGNDRPVGIGKPNFMIVFGNEPLQEFSSLPLAEVIRTSDGTLTLNPRNVPPSLSIAASDSLMGLTRKILELCVAKSRALSERRKQQPAGQLDYSTADVIVLGLLQVINATIPTLTHQFTVSRCHPEALFLTLSTLASELMTFSAEADLRPADLPTYNHSNLWDSFSILEVKISQLLEAVISANFLSIRLDKRGDTRWSGKITDEGLLRTAQFYLMTSGDVPERKVVDEMPMKIKIAGPEDIDTLVAAALQGLSLTFVPRPPSGLPVRPGLQYFRLEKTGPLWESVRKSCAVGIFLPGEFRGLKVELVAVKET